MVPKAVEAKGLKRRGALAGHHVVAEGPARGGGQRDAEHRVPGREVEVLAGWLLNRVDPTNRLRRVALACRLAGIGYLPWRTRAEVAQSPNSASMGSGIKAADSPPVVLARAVLLFDTTKLADDVTVRLRRQVR